MALDMEIQSMRTLPNVSIRRRTQGSMFGRMNDELASRDRVDGKLRYGSHLYQRAKEIVGMAGLMPRTQIRRYVVCPRCGEGARVGHGELITRHWNKEGTYCGGVGIWTGHLEKFESINR